MPGLGKSGTSRMSRLSGSQFTAALIDDISGIYHAPSIRNVFSPATGWSSVSSTLSTRAALGPCCKRDLSAESCSPVPVASTSTVPSVLLRTQPEIPSIFASRSTNQRKPTPCTRPRTTNFLVCTSAAISTFSQNCTHTTRSKAALDQQSHERNRQHTKGREDDYPGAFCL